MTEREKEQRIRYPSLFVDVECTDCGKLVALANAFRSKNKYLCPQCTPSYSDPTEKTPEMEEFLDGVSKQAFGRSRKEAFGNNICVVCSSDASNFKDRLSEKEYFISGLCQKCQDLVFTGEEE